MKMKSWLYIAFSFLALVSCLIIFLVKGWGELLGLFFFQTWFVWNAYAYQRNKTMFAPPPSQNLPPAANSEDRHFLLLLSIALSLSLNLYCIFAFVTLTRKI